MERKKHSYSSDDWLPPEDEIGLKVVQTLRKPESSVKARGISASKRTDNFNIHLKDRSPIKRPKTDLFVDVIPRRKDISTSSKGYNDKHDVAEARPKASEFTALTKQEQDITSMFTDGEGEGNGDNNNQQPAEDDGDAVELGSQEVVIQSCTDDTTIHGVEDQASHPPEQMGFIDEESAANYRRLLEQSKRTYKNANVRKNRQNQPVQDDSVYSQTSSSSHSSPSAPHTQLLAEKSTMATDTTTSIDGLPDDPLEAVSPTAPNTYSPRSRTRPLHRLHQRPHISDSETTNEEMEFLDQGIVIKKRLRTRPAVSAARNRVEQARRSMNQHSYESDSDFESTPKDSGRQQIREFVDDTENVSLLQDMPETDSESERKQSSTVLVIHGSSDEDGDFVSNPDDLPESYGSSSGLAPQKAALDTFWSAFDKRRRPQLKHRHRLSKSVEVSEEAPIKVD
ncbi:hypothetical protein COEREDRAFT_101210 [Coemansia reversa NRRL 1564]|uniref:Uncharacterized protein n=1 Tax=Coemansia reversa (strain ATCC 12441 / NRRL 1564) TaxID=763665 RepID=A0A2G5BGL6_COERN|nr:hypothetical protein COEREDRAFT_101210 [Coemansia reversa NRRL 1564]|eukprot:PIA18150.1 hypothetical protein COEREDRAFT_101210 [Coemansia reversa NRRL 1564]